MVEVYIEHLTFKDMTGEYFCRSCLQLRGSFRDDIKMCGNCGSQDIVIGKVMELNKDVLMEEELNKRRNKTAERER